MPTLLNSATGQNHTVPTQTVRELLRLRHIMGVDWYNAQLNHFPVTETGFVDADEFVETLRNKQGLELKEEEKPVEPLKTPIIPEIGEDGVKRLYKTRYNQLEQKYVALHAQNLLAQSRVKSYRKDFEEAHHDKCRLENEVEELKNLTVDGAKLDKRIDQLCKVAQIQLPPTPYGMVSLEQKLDTFFGALLCRIRVEEIQDELAD
jgi:hypothetical protein